MDKSIIKSLLENVDEKQESLPSTSFSDTCCLKCSMAVFSLQRHNVAKLFYELSDWFLKTGFITEKVKLREIA